MTFRIMRVGKIYRIDSQSGWFGGWREVTWMDTFQEATAWLDELESLRGETIAHIREIDIK